MPRKVKIPLLMDNTSVSTIEDMRKHFDPVAVLRYYNQNLLQHWLRMHNHGDICDEVEKLDKDASDFSSRLCQLLFEDHSYECPVTLEDVAYEDEKLERLKALTTESIIWDKVSDIALSQEDLERLYRFGKKQIILFNGIFTIDPHQSGVKYTKYDKNGTAQVIIPAEENTDFSGREFELEQVPFGWDAYGITEDDEIYQAEQMMMGRKWKEALPILEKHAEKDHPRALVLLEIYYESQKDKNSQYAQAGRKIGSVQSGILRRKTEAELKLMEVLAQKGDALSQALYGFACLHSDRKEEGFAQLKKAVDRCPWVLYQLGFYYEKTDVNQSKQCFMKAAESGFIPAVMQMILLSANEQEKQKWLDEMAAQGVTMEPKQLFIQGEQHLLNGQYTEAAQYYEQAATLGYAPAQMRLGCCYLNGKGVEQDNDKGMDYLQKAVNQDDAAAVYAQGLWWFHCGNKQDATTCGLFTRAADSRYAPAYCMLSLVYQVGLFGVLKNIDRSNAYYAAAKSAGLSGDESFSGFDLLTLPREDSPYNIECFMLRSRMTGDTHPGKAVLMRIFGNPNYKLPSNLEIEVGYYEHEVYIINASVLKVYRSDFEQLISYFVEFFGLFTFNRKSNFDCYYSAENTIDILNETYKMEVRIHPSSSRTSEKISHSPKDYNKITLANITKIEKQVDSHTDADEDLAEKAEESIPSDPMKKAAETVKKTTIGLLAKAFESLGASYLQRVDADKAMQTLQTIMNSVRNSLSEPQIASCLVNIYPESAEIQVPSVGMVKKGSAISHNEYNNLRAYLAAEQQASKQERITVIIPSTATHRSVQYSFELTITNSRSQITLSNIRIL